MCYLVEGRVADSSYRLLQRVIEDGSPTLCVSRLYPDRVSSKYGLVHTKLAWISTSPGDDHYDPTAIGTLASAIEAFIDHNPRGCVILLDGLEYLTLHVGFDKALLFVEHLNEYVMARRASLIIPVSPDCFKTVELARLERYTEQIEQADLRDALDLGATDRSPPPG